MIESERRTDAIRGRIAMDVINKQMISVRVVWSTREYMSSEHIARKKASAITRSR